MGRDAAGSAPAYLADWDSTPSQGMPLRLGLDDADRLAAGIEQVVSLAGEHGELTDGDPRRRRDVHLVPALDGPAAPGELAVDVLACLFFGGHRLSRQIMGRDQRG